MGGLRFRVAWWSAAAVFVTILAVSVLLELPWWVDVLVAAVSVASTVVAQRITTRASAALSWESGWTAAGRRKRRISGHRQRHEGGGEGGAQPAPPYSAGAPIPAGPSARPLSVSLDPVGERAWAVERELSRYELAHGAAVDYFDDGGPGALWSSEGSSLNRVSQRREWATAAQRHLIWLLADEPGPWVTLIHGEPGSGKTTLARQLTRQVGYQAEDVHWVNLRGGAVSTRDALMHLVNRLGGSRHTLLFHADEDQDAQLARLRSTYESLLVKGDPVLLVLDDAGSAEDVLSLVPQGARVAALVTSRNTLPELEAARGAYTVGLGRLDEDTSRTLLPPHPAVPDTIRLVRASGGIPLTLRIAASIPDGRVPERFSDDPEGIMRAAFDALPEEARRVLRSLPLVGEASFGAPAASVLGEVSVPVAGQVLDALAEAGFLERAHAERYRLHAVVREFAGRRLDAESSPMASGALQLRLVRAYADLAELAIRQVDGRSSAPDGTPVRDGGPAPESGPAPVFGSADEAVRWFEEERSFVTATLRRAEHADPEDVQRLLVALCEFCVLRGDQYRLSRVNELARDLGRATMVNSARFHNAIAARQVGELSRAETDLQAMVDTQREASDPDGEARALRNLGITYHHEGRLKAAEAVLRKAVRHQGPAHLRYYRAWSLHALAAVVRDQGRLDEALGLLTEALDLHCEADSPHGQAWALLHWGQVHLLLGEIDAAEGKLRQCRELYREVHDERGESWAYTQLGRSTLLRGSPERAVHELTQSLRWHRKNEDARGVAWTSYYIGLAHDASDDLRHAEDALTTAEAQFTELGDHFGLERCRDDLARVRSPRVRLRLLDDDVQVGSAAAIHVDLAVPRSHPWDSAGEDIVVVATARPGADVEPYLRPYRTGSPAPAPAAFTFTARETGSHQVNFRIYHEGYGVLLQEVATTLEIPATTPEIPPAAPRRS